MPVLLLPSIRSRDFTSTAWPYLLQAGEGAAHRVLRPPVASAICATVTHSCRRGMARTCSCFVPSHGLRGAPVARVPRRKIALHSMSIALAMGYAVARERAGLCMSATATTIRVVIPLTLRKRNGRPKSLPPEDAALPGSHGQDLHVLRAIA